MMERITSLTNEKIKHYSKLNQKKYRSRYDEFIIEGLNQINEAKENLKLIITTDMSFSYNDKDILYVSEEVIYKIYPQKPIVKYIAVCSLINNEFDDTDLVVLNKIKDPGNLGNLIRTSVALGYKNILIDDDSVDIYNDKVLRAAHGSIFKANIIKTDAYDFLLNNDYSIVTTFLDEASDFNKKDNKLAIIFGNEANGIESKYKDLPHDNFKIDIIFESLNVASAGAIVLYDLKRRMK